MKFAEIFWGAAGSRIFDVSINGNLVLDDFDIVADTGASFTAVSKVFNNITPAAGQIAVQFGPATADNAQVCALQINPMIPTPTPTRTPCAPTIITPYIQVGSGIWQASSSVIVSQGSAVSLGPQPSSGGTWSWTGPGGFTSSSREITNIQLSTGINTYIVVHTNSCGSQSTQVFTVTLLEPAEGETVAGCASGMVIDGNMNETAWNSVPEYAIDKLCLGTNANNISGSFKTLWDTSGLYIGLDISDPYLNAPQVACATYNNSAVEIYLDMANDRGAKPFPSAADDFHFIISYDAQHFCWNARVAMPPSGMQYASTNVSGGYVMEVKLPWAILKPNSAILIGDTYQFDVQIDFNNGTSERVGQLVWNGDANNWESSANFGDVRLGYCPSPTPTVTPVPPPLAESFRIFPNPVNPKQSQVRIKYHIFSESEISINIFTINGSHVRTILDKALKPAGWHTEDTWDAKNEPGFEVMSGVYLCVLEARDRHTGATTRFARKLAVLR